MYKLYLSKLKRMYNILYQNYVTSLDEFSIYLENIYQIVHLKHIFLSIITF